MSFDIHWLLFVKKRPKLDKEDAVVEITAKNLKSLMRQAYEKGYADGEKDTNPFDFLEQTIFGGKR